MTADDEISSGLKEVHYCVCQLCGEEWVATHQSWALVLECPACHYKTGFIDFTKLVKPPTYEGPQ